MHQGAPVSINHATHIVSSFGIGASLEQRSYGFNVTGLTGSMQGGPANLINQHHA